MFRGRLLKHVWSIILAQVLVPSLIPLIFKRSMFMPIGSQLASIVFLVRPHDHIIVMGHWCTHCLLGAVMFIASTCLRLLL